jgi:hypothetical protein
MLSLLLALLLPQAPNGAPDIAEIMARVAENQDRAREARKQWVFQQDVLVRLHRTNGKLAREETRKYLVTPTPTGLERKLQSQEGGEHKDGLDLDGDLVQSFAEDEDLNIGDKNKDGVSKEMFPLTAAEQSKYIFKLEGREDYRGASVYRVSFRPKPKREDADWKGEALIDAVEFEPVLVTTSLGVNIPFLVKTLLGTDVQHLGFKITYKKVADGVWFPATYGGEFYVRGLFLYKRNISLSVKNDDFRKTDVDSKITFEK